MNIVLTGSLGNIGKPLTQQLVQKGHSVTVISSNKERQKDIEKLGATAAIGTMQDISFLTNTFVDADIVYLMETINSNKMMDSNFTMISHISQIGENYKKAVLETGIKRIVLLSSVGAHTNYGNGNLEMHYNVENILNQLPNDVFIKIMRPTGFFTNLFRSIQTIKSKGAIISNYGGDKKEPWVSPIDIASTIAEEMELPFIKSSIRYIASEELSPNQIAQVIGNAIGIPDLKWIKISNEQLLQNLLSIGMNEQIARGFVEMQVAQGNGTLYKDYYKNKPILGKIKLADFAKDFALAYNN